MKKIIYLMFVFCLYSFPVISNDINNEIVEKEVSPKDININDAWRLLDSRVEYAGIAKIHFSLNRLLLKNYAEGYRDAIANNLSYKVSQKTKNCLTRPMKMFYDEIFDSYRKGEVGNNESFSKALKDKMANCANSSDIKINFN